MKSDDRVTSSWSSSTGYRVKLKALPRSVVCSHMGPATDAQGLWLQCREILPGQTRALLLRPEQRLKGNCLPEVNVEASRFMELKCVREELSYV